MKEDKNLRRLTFHFAINPYFRNRVIWKEYRLKLSGKRPVPVQGVTSMGHEAAGWKEGSAP